MPEQVTSLIFMEATGLRGKAYVEVVEDDLLDCILHTAAASSILKRQLYPIAGDYLLPAICIRVTRSACSCRQNASVWKPCSNGRRLKLTMQSYARSMLRKHSESPPGSPCSLAWHACMTKCSSATRHLLDICRHAVVLQKHVMHQFTIIDCQHARVRIHTLHDLLLPAKNMSAAFGYCLTEASNCAGRPEI